MANCKLEFEYKYTIHARPPTADDWAGKSACVFARNVSWNKATGGRTWPLSWSCVEANASFSRPEAAPLFHTDRS